MDTTLLKYLTDFMDTGNPWLDIGLFILLVIMLLHILVKLIFQKYFTPVNVDKVIIQRLKKDKPDQSDDSENQLAWNYLEELFHSWTTVTEEGENVFRSPTSNKMLSASKRKLQQIISIQSTDSDIIARTNELGEVLNGNAKRIFTGSRMLLVASPIVWLASAYFFRGEGESFFSALYQHHWIWIGILLYVLSSFSPGYLIDKRIEKVGNYKINSVLFAYLAAIVLSGPTYYQVIHYKDETSSLSSDVGCFGLLVIFALLAFCGYFIVFFAILNYFRNYVLYF